ncbi:hypothetical protein K488DRAFT_83620 [Vararia minispora EC-137]|uniref:Uncharacterized protein n=1 Tax=Vararia minispora EC-137 TaxID=1314806 RepID=A0ACB8QT75_9AGAM|nr:hypothetical protein K488DRAFT_83620 [Vararia minispora EC-137]
MPPFTPDTPRTPFANEELSIPIHVSRQVIKLSGNAYCRANTAIRAEDGILFVAEEDLLKESSRKLSESEMICAKELSLSSLHWPQVKLINWSEPLAFTLLSAWLNQPEQRYLLQTLQQTRDQEGLKCTKNGETLVNIPAWLHDSISAQSRDGVGPMIVSRAVVDDWIKHVSQTTCLKCRHIPAAHLLRLCEELKALVKGLSKVSNSARRLPAEVDYACQIALKKSIPSESSESAGFPAPGFFFPAAFPSPRSQAGPSPSPAAAAHAPLRQSETGLSKQFAAFERWLVLLPTI